MTPDEPVPVRTIPQALRHRVAASGDALAVVDGTTRLTFRELAAEAGLRARALLASGLAPGDRVAIWAPNSWQWVVAAFAAWDAGGVVVPISTRSKGYEAQTILADTGARFLVVFDRVLDIDVLSLLVAEAGPAEGDRPFRDLPALEQVVVVATERGVPDGTTGWDELAVVGRGVPIADLEARAAAVAGDDLAEVLATSGSTGAPKGVMLEHASLLRSFWDWSVHTGQRPGDAYLAISPFSHGFGINGAVVTTVLRGLANIPMAAFDPVEALALVERERVSVLTGPPTLFAALLDHPRFAEHDTSSLRVAVVGAAVVPPELIERLLDLGFERVVNGYGLIEGNCVCVTRHDDDREAISTTVGRPLPGVSLRLVDDDGHDVPPGQPGEVLVEGFLMRGYWGADELTAATITPDGWLHTGDVGELEDGRLRIVGRKKEMFTFGGFSVYPAEVENLLRRSPEVADVAVVAVPDERYGEVGMAYVVPADPAAFDGDALLLWARESMSNYKVPRRVAAIDALPLNANGKVDKPLLVRGSPAG